MPSVHDEGICVRHWDWSETSQTVTLLTRGHGLIRCLAKGSRREKSPFSGGVELLTRGTLTAIIKANSELAQLTSWDLAESMPEVRRTFARYAACMYAVDLIPRTLQDHDPHPALYDALASTLGAVGADPSCEDRFLPAWIAWFQWRVLDETGSKPEVRLDVRTGRTLDPGAPVGFAWEWGGLTGLPHDAAGPAGGGGGANGVGPSGIDRIRPATAGVLRSLDAGTPANGLPGTADEITRAGRVLAARIRGLIGYEPPALAWVFPEISRSDTV